MHVISTIVGKDEGSKLSNSERGGKKREEGRARETAEEKQERDLNCTGSSGVEVRAERLRCEEKAL